MSSLLDALEYAGSVLEKPGRVVRGLLAGRPGEALAGLPFSDTMGLTDPSQRTSGRDLLSMYGMGTGDDSLDSLLGFGADVATDPTTYLGLGLGAKAANVSRLGNAEDLGTVLFKMAPKQDPLAAVPGPLLKRLQGLAFTPEDIPSAASVAGLPPDLANVATEAGIRSSVGRRQLAEEAARTMPEMVFDPAHFPAVPEPIPASQPRPFPAFSDWAPWLGDPWNPDAPSLVKDAVMDRQSPETLHRIAAMEWEKALGQLAGFNPQTARADPGWRAAMMNRLVELGAVKSYGHIMPFPPDLLPTVDSQLGQIHSLLGIGPSDYRGMGYIEGKLAGGAGEMNLDQLRRNTGYVGNLPRTEVNALADLAGGAWEPRHLRPGRSVHDMLMEAERSPLLQPDMAAARQVAGRREMLDAASEIRSLIDDASLEPEFRSFYPDYLDDVFRGQTDRFTIDALKGAIRKNPDIREGIPLIVQTLGEAGYLPPNYLLKYAGG